MSDPPIPYNLEEQESFLTIDETPDLSDSSEVAIRALGEQKRNEVARFLMEQLQIRVNINQAVLNL